MNLLRISLPGALGKSQLCARKDPRRWLMIESLEPRAMLATFLVNNTSDSGMGSLRQAILEANNASGRDSVIFVGVPGPIQLTTGPLDVTGAVTIDGSNILNPGPGGGPVTVRSTTNSRVFRVASTFLEGDNQVSIVDMNILGPGSGMDGGGIEVSQAGNLRLDRVTISDGVASIGGGIANLGLTSISNSTISGNSATLSGGIDNYGNATLSLDNSTVSGNSAGTYGGGVFAAGSAVFITRSTITGNSAANGGGLYASPRTQVTLQNSIVGGNTATFGPDVSATRSESFDAITALTPPTLDGNVTASGWVGALRSTNAANASSGIFQGNPATFPAQSGTGYVGMNFNNTTGTNTISTWIMSPVINMNNGDTFSFYTRTVDAPTFPDRLEVRRSSNFAGVDVGANANTVGDFTNLLLTINPTLTTNGYPNAWTQFSVTISGLAAPTSGRLAFRYFVTNGGPTGANSFSIGIDNFQYTAALATDHSLIQNPNGHKVMNGVAGNIVGVSPNLGPLANNGGPTRTHLPNAGSPVINAGNGSRVSDQRLFTGVMGPAVDIGSIEVGGANVGDLNGDGLYNIADLDLLCMAVAAGTRPSSDVDSWLSVAATFNGLGSPYKKGDANLDGVADGSDFNIWNANKFTASMGKWSRGDFNCDGVTDGQDFNIWNGNKFTSSDLARGSNFAGSVPTGLAAEQDLPLSSRAAGSMMNIQRMEADRDFSSGLQTRLSRGMLTERQAAVFAQRGSVAEVVFKRSGALPLSDFAPHRSPGTALSKRPDHLQVTSPVRSPSVNQQFASRPGANVGTKPNSAFPAIARAKSTVQLALSADRVDVVHRLL